MGIRGDGVPLNEDLRPGVSSPARHGDDVDLFDIVTILH